MKWPLALTGLGTAVVVAAIIVNHTSSPDRLPDAPPDLGSTMVALGPLPPSTAGLLEQEETAGSPSFDLIRIAHDGHTVIAGQAEPGSRVVVLDDETPLGSVLADARGEWVFLPSAPLQPGPHRLKLSAQAGDRPVMQSEDRMVVVVPGPGEDMEEAVVHLRDQPLTKKVSNGDHGPVAVFQSRRQSGLVRSFSRDPRDHETKDQ